MAGITVNNNGLVGGVDPTQVYINKNLPWMQSNNNLSSTTEMQDVWKWLLSSATTAQEKNEVSQEESYDKANPDNLSALGNGIDENTLLGWAMMGVDPFNPYGPTNQSPDANALKAAVSDAFTTIVTGQNGYDKDPHVRKANELLHQTLVVVQATYDHHVKTLSENQLEEAKKDFPVLSA
jgi:hypothetical protein